MYDPQYAFALTQLHDQKLLPGYEATIIRLLPDTAQHIAKRSGPHLLKYKNIDAVKSVTSEDGLVRITQILNQPLFYSW